VLTPKFCLRRGYTVSRFSRGSILEDHSMNISSKATPLPCQ